MILLESGKEADISFRVEDLTPDVVDEIGNLAAAHCDEVFPIHFDLDIQKDGYVEAAKSGIIRAFTLRRHGRLVGYSIFLVGKHPHFGIKTATQDAIYILPEYRRGQVGRFFIQSCDISMKEEGIKLVFQHTLIKKDLSKLFKSLGYSEVQKTFMKELQ